jgi:hypothetical protein
VKRQVDGPEEIGEPFGSSPCIGHGTRVAASQSIVNPDESAARLRGCPAGLAGPVSIHIR